MSYEVALVDGPARGWSYVSEILPDDKLVLIPYPGRLREWVRVIETGPSWRGQLVYERVPNAPETVDRHGDQVIIYRLKSHLRRRVSIAEEGEDFVLLSREGTEERFVVSWGAPDDEPSVGTVSPCSDCGWKGTCEEGCHS